jgi:hypothetical protein
VSVVGESALGRIGARLGLAVLAILTVVLNLLVGTGVGLAHAAESRLQTVAVAEFVSNYDGAVPSYDASVLFVDARTVAQADAVGRHATAVPLRRQVHATSEGPVSVSGFGVAAKSGGGVVRHYTTKEAAESISKEGVLRPGASGKTWLTTDRYASGAEARSGLALNKSPDGYFEVPMCRVLCPSGPSRVEPFYRQPGGGTEITTEFPINVGGLSFNPFGVG